MKKRPDSIPEPRVTDIFPSTNRIPVNLLRFYIYFSEPMREGDFLDHIKLIDSEGNNLKGVFFDNQYELWNGDHTRLTILIDPGRVKTGLRANKTMGRAFAEGETYQLVVDKSWTSLSGKTLEQTYTKEFRAIPECKSEVDTAKWKIKIPEGSTKDPIQINFGDPVDHISANRFIVILDSFDNQFLVKKLLFKEERKLLIFPESKWKPGAYKILIHPRFEDIVGNNLYAAFDHKVGEVGTENKKPVIIPIQINKPEPPPYKLFRAEEDFSYLKSPKENPFKEDYLDPLKFVGINKSRTINFTIGGELRPRIEHFNNRNWEPVDETFYSQRISLHSNINITRHLRLFGELYHGALSKSENEIAESDQLDWHQGFLEIIFGRRKNFWSLRFGRQEMAFGATRLIGIREGPNIRRSFDMGRIIYKIDEVKTELFYGKEVSPRFGAFDNESGLFDSNAPNPSLWGIYSQFAIRNDLGKTELYYLGFHSPQSFYNDASGKDVRHTLGIRRFGKVGPRVSYNTELMYQAGETAGKQVSSWALETDWQYTFIKAGSKPQLGIKLEFISGDKEFDDNRIQTFNPMFSNPAYYSLAGIIAPVNLIEFHPSFAMTPVEHFKIYLEWASFYRFSIADGIYSPPRFLNRPGQSTDARFIGNQLGMKLSYEFDRHLRFDLDFSYFITGQFLEETGVSNNAVHLAPTLSYRF